MDNAKIRNFLHQVGVLYAGSTKPPTDAKAFFEENKRDLPREGIEAYEQGYFVTNFGPRTTGHTLLVYEKEGYTDGSRLALFADGSVEMLTPDQFQAAQKGK
jgi:hypothetical protein